MKNDFLKNIFMILLIVLLLFAFSIINKNFLKDNNIVMKNDYINELSQKINSNDIANINYNYLLNDLNNIDEILKDQLSYDLDIKKKTNYYARAEEVYSNKINEITKILNEKLDDEDFLHLQDDLDEFYKNLDNASDEIKSTNESTIDAEYYVKKYFYEEKQSKCRELLNNYKGFLS